MCATLFTQKAMFRVMVKRKLKLTQNEVHSASSQKYHGTRTGIPRASNAKSGSLRRFCHITIGSACKSLMSMLFRLATTSGCGVRKSHATCAKKNPRRASCGSAFVSEYLWWMRWSWAHVYASRWKSKNGNLVEVNRFAYLACRLSLTCPDIVNKNVRIKRNCHVALYALCDQSRWAPAVIPKPEPMIRTKTTKKKMKRRNIRDYIYDESFCRIKWIDACNHKIQTNK